jgi:hypothetical protein
VEGTEEKDEEKKSIEVNKNDKKVVEVKKNNLKGESDGFLDRIDPSKLKNYQPNTNLDPIDPFNPFPNNIEN